MEATPPAGAAKETQPEASAPEMAVEASKQVSVAEPEQTAAPKQPEFDWQTFAIKSGDTLSSLFKKAGFNDGIMLSVIHGDGEADKLQRLYAGETIRFATTDDGSLAAIDLQRNRLETLKIKKNGESFTGETEIRKPEARPAFASGTIDGSLYLAARKPA